LTRRACGGLIRIAKGGEKEMAEKKYSEEDYQLVFGGKTKDQVELEQIRILLEKFIEKYGGQYICTVIWPEKGEKPPQKGVIPMGSSHVKTMTSGRYREAVNALVSGEVMFKK
jgi:hypothetical protein